MGVVAPGDPPSDDPYPAAAAAADPIPAAAECGLDWSEPQDRPYADESPMGSAAAAEAVAAAAWCAWWNIAE